MPEPSPGARVPGILSVAQFIREHRRSIARTLRETFGIGLSDLGDAVTWGEAWTLLEDAASDPGTALGAELAGWAYPASMRELLTLVATIGDQKAARKVMPWVMKNPRNTEDAATTDEVASAEAALEVGIVFAT